MFHVFCDSICAEAWQCKLAREYTFSWLASVLQCRPCICILYLYFCIWSHSQDDALFPTHLNQLIWSCGRTMLAHVTELHLHSHFIWACICTHICACICTYICACVCTYIWLVFVHIFGLYLYISLRMYLYTYLGMYLYIYLRMYLYIYLSKYLHMFLMLVQCACDRLHLTPTHSRRKILFHAHIFACGFEVHCSAECRSRKQLR